MEVTVLNVSTNVSINVVTSALHINGTMNINGTGKASGGEFTCYVFNDQKQERTVGRVTLGYTPTGTTYNVFEQEAGLVEAILSDAKAVVADIETKFSNGTLKAQ